MKHISLTCYSKLNELRDRIRSRNIEAKKFFIIKSIAKQFDCIFSFILKSLQNDKKFLKRNSISETQKIKKRHGKG